MSDLYAPSSIDTRSGGVRRKQMSIQFRFPPGAFVKHDGIKLFDAQAAGHVERKLKEKRDKPFACKSPSAPLRDDHIVLLAVDVLVALYAAFRKWRNHRRTLRALDELDDTSTEGHRSQARASV